MIGQSSPVDPTVKFADQLKAMRERIAELERAMTQVDVWAPVTDPAVVSANWSLVSFDADASPRWAQFLLVVQRTTTTLTVPDGTGNITNETVATLPAACRGTVTIGVPIGAGSTGRGVFATYVPSSGLVRLNAFGSPDDVAIGEQFSFGGTVRVTP